MPILLIYLCDSPGVTPELHEEPLSSASAIVRECGNSANLRCPQQYILLLFILSVIPPCVSSTYNRLGKLSSKVVTLLTNALIKI